MKRFFECRKLSALQWSAMRGHTDDFQKLGIQRLLAAEIPNKGGFNNYSFLSSTILYIQI